LVLAHSSLAQGKKFTMAEATNGLGTTLAPQNIKNPSWQPGTHRFYQAIKVNGKDAWLGTEIPTGETDTLTLAQLNAGLFKGDTLKGLPPLQWLSDGRLWFQRGQKLYFHNALRAPDATPVIRAVPPSAENITIGPQRGGVAYTVGNNLFLNIDGTGIQVSSDTAASIVNGQAVHRNEFGIDGGIFFSPKGNYLAYYRMDQTMVKDYPVIRWNEVPARVDLIKYPMAGGPSHRVLVRVFNPATGKNIDLQTGEPQDQYLTSVTWSPDEKYIFVGVLNRDQNHLWLNQYDAQTGTKLRTLFEETDERYVEPQHELSFLPGKNDEFLWWSQRDGYMHLYRYNTSGKLLNQVTKGPWLVNELLGFNAKTREVLFTASKESPLDKNIYATSWTGGKVRRIDNESGTHSASASEDGQYVYDLVSSNTVVRQARIRSTDGRFQKLLLDAPNTLAGYDRPEVRTITMKADDGTVLYGKLILPTGFDSTRKYPSLTYLYNGPHVQLVKNAFPASGNLWYELMAQKGYVVFIMDGRGSSNRGLAFEQATFRKLGTVEMSDQLQGVSFLKSLPYVDATRMGVHGWSFGGFMTTSLMLRHPGTFSTGVAGGPVMDWSLYEVMYTERYMDDPKQNPQGFAEAKLLDKVKNLKGNLMLIHGTDDDVVVWQHSINFLKAAVDEGVQVDYFVYPGHPHNVRGKDRVHLMQKITDYFDAHLKP
jgi:dipeptidyl-peptidase-4